MDDTTKAKMIRRIAAHGHPFPAFGTIPDEDRGDDLKPYRTLGDWVDDLGYVRVMWSNGSITETIVQSFIPATVMAGRPLRSVADVANEVPEEIMVQKRRMIRDHGMPFPPMGVVFDWASGSHRGPSPIGSLECELDGVVWTISLHSDGSVGVVSGTRHDPAGAAALAA